MNNTSNENVNIFDETKANSNFSLEIDDVQIQAETAHIRQEITNPVEIMDFLEDAAEDLH